MNLFRRIGRYLWTMNPDVQDVLLAIWVGVVTLAIARQAVGEGEPAFGDSVEPTVPFGVMVLLGPSALLAVRRRWPLAALGLGTVLQMVIWGLGYRDIMLAVTILIASAGYFGGRVGRRAATQAAVVLTLWTTIGYLAGSAPLLAVPTVAFYVAFAATFGQHVASRAELAKAVEEIEQELRHRQAADAVRVRQEEQNRLARELHDIVAHNLSVIVVHAEAARRGTDPEDAAESLLLVATTARVAMDEMREVVGALRTSEDAAWTPIQSLDYIDSLVDQMEAAGLTIRSTIDVPPTLSLATQVSGYRLVQESLTNALKHGGAGTTVELSIVTNETRHGGAMLDIGVVDDGGGPDARVSFEPGHGLKGMNERANLLGGSFSASRRPGGGFEVRARLPIDGVNP